MPSTDDHDFTPEQKAELEKYRTAFQQEWAERTPTSTREETRKELDKEFDELVVDALVALKYDIKFAQVPQIRQKAYMYVLDMVIEDRSKGKLSDPFTELLSGMNAASTPEKKATPQ